jgi:hypothetical protein
VAAGSIIVTPAPGAFVTAGESIEISGWAWSFRGVSTVYVSVDGGKRYERATLEPRHGWGWQRFVMPWRPVDRGPALLSVPAFEGGGGAQPFDGARNEVHTVRVVMR